ncbi:hypothetical protein Nepgr_011734 [Nepenthes gracilis]|uniref:Uncharacterized protein n=1 Tax=Nepenthes gracilis TaxID=150966 RepID=A0AAD3SEV7_NEPGR|nr:hypothetical protein Nepgr_011734 [Nepenthes gracilis]
MKTLQLRCWARGCGAATAMPPTLAAMTATTMVSKYLPEKQLSSWLLVIGFTVVVVAAGGDDEGFAAVGLAAVRASLARTNPLPNSGNILNILL